MTLCYFWSLQNEKSNVELGIDSVLSEIYGSHQIVVNYRFLLKERDLHKSIIAAFFTYYFSGKKSEISVFI